MPTVRSLITFISLAALPLAVALPADTAATSDSAATADSAAAAAPDSDSAASSDSADSSTTTTRDYIIVGGGPAGYVAAETLSRSSNTRVTLLEAGPDGSSDPNINVPAYLVFAATPTYLWTYNSQPDPSLGGLTPNIWQGKALGGGAAVNAMTYCRGSSSTFDDWAKISGNNGLKWSSFLNDFKATSHYTFQPANYNQYVNTSAYGKGPIEVSRQSEITTMNNPFAQALHDSLNINEVDMNDGNGIGISLGLNTIRVSNRTRSYPPNTYGWLMANRPNVKILPNSWVQKVGFNGKTAQNVTYIDTKTNKVTTLKAKEIILAAGAINTPQLLMLSGVGPKSTLDKVKIPVVADIADVGQNLYDHHFSSVEVQATADVETFYQIFQNASNSAVVTAEYQKNASGPLGNAFGGEWGTARIPDSAFNGVNGTHYTSLSKDKPHVLYEFGAFPVVGQPNVSAASAWASLVQPEGNGYVTLNTSSYKDAPLVYSNYYKTDADKAAIKYAYKKLRSLFTSAPLKPFEVKELFPGSQATSDADIWKAIQQSAASFHHPLGSVALGKVVGSDWRVKGLKGIRVVDSSVIPYPPTCHTQSSVYAVAHLAAHDIAKADGVKAYSADDSTSADLA